MIRVSIDIIRVIHDCYAYFAKLGHTALICKNALNSCQYHITTAYIIKGYNTQHIRISDIFYSDFIEHDSILCNRMSISWRHLQALKSNQLGCNEQTELQRPWRQKELEIQP